MDILRRTSKKNLLFEGCSGIARLSDTFGCFELVLTVQTRYAVYKS